MSKDSGINYLGMRSFKDKKSKEAKNNVKVYTSWQQFLWSATLFFCSKIFQPIQIIILDYLSWESVISNLKEFVGNEKVLSTGISPQGCPLWDSQFRIIFMTQKKKQVGRIKGKSIKSWESKISKKRSWIRAFINKKKH